MAYYNTLAAAKESNTLNTITSLTLNPIEKQTISPENLIQILGLFNNLTSLTLAKNNINDQTFAEIQKLPFFENLKDLDIHNNNITRNSIKTLATKKLNLKTLNLSQNPIKDMGLKFLGGGSGHKKLRKLGLKRTKITDEGINKYLLNGRAKFLLLTELDISGNGSALELSDFLASSNFKKLKTLKI